MECCITIHRILSACETKNQYGYHETNDKQKKKKKMDKWETIYGMGFMWVCFEKMEHYGQSKTKCEIDLIQFSLTKNYIIKDETISAMEGEEKGEIFHTFLVSDDSGKVLDEISFPSSGSCEEEKVSSLMRGRESLLTERSFDSHGQQNRRKKKRKRAGVRFQKQNNKKNEMPNEQCKA